MNMTNPRTAAVRIAAPAAVVGTLAAALTAAPAGAAEVRSAAAASHAPSVRTVPTAASAPRTVVRPVVARPSDYTIRPGDTVSSVAARHGVATADLLAWNGLGWRSVIFPGQKLRLSPASAPSTTAPPAAAPAATHTVVPGDTVFAIAKRYGTTVSAIMSINGIAGSAIITPGQTLRVAAGSTPAPAPVSAVAPAAPPAAAAPASHTVAAGDTLFAIARKYATSVSHLLQVNGLGEGSIIYPGQALRLTAPAPAPAAAATAPQRSAALDATQTAHAAHIVRVGRELGVPDRGIAIALATAMVESSMRNLDHGDRDSLGLFQQRPSQGWGTTAQALDADRSIRVFYGGADDPNGSATRGLLDIPGWQDMPFTAAAQAVQVSAYPDRYGMWERQANQWLATLR